MTDIPGGLAEVLQRLRAVAGDSEHVVVGELRDGLAERAWPLLLVLFSLPFITPIPTMGLSMPFGLGIAGIGIGIALSRPPPIPGFVLRKRIRSDLLCKLADGGASVAKRLDKLMKPRAALLVDGFAVRLLHGLTICIAGILLALPLPIPLSNALPSWTLIALGLGLLQRDGMAVVVGHALALVTYGFFIAIAMLGTMGVTAALGWAK